MSDARARESTERDSIGRDATVRTPNLRVVLADDEPIARRGLERLLNAEQDVELVAACRNGPEVLTAIRTHRPALAFLDVAMPGMSGLDVARALSAAERPAIVFVTAFDRYAIDAFDLHAVDYLLKPFDVERFRTALSRARERVQRQGPGREQETREVSFAAIDALLDALNQRRHAHAPAHAPAHASADASADAAGHAPARIVVKQGDRILFVPLGDIDWCEAADNYVKLCVGGRRHLVRDTMRAMERQLGPSFARIHRSVIVNLDRVRELRPLLHGDYQVLLHDGTRLTLSRGYRDPVMARIGARERG